MEHLAERLAQIPGVEVVTLGGSRAAGRRGRIPIGTSGSTTARRSIPMTSAALGFAGEVFAPGEWGTVPNGGAWLEVDGARVDLVYRDLATVEEWTADAEAGRFRVFREVGYVAGAPTYSYAAELAINRNLVGSLPRPDFPAALRARAPEFWRRLAIGGLKFADAHARRDDAVRVRGQPERRRARRPRTRGCARGASGT